MFLPHFDVFCDLLLNRQTQHGIYLIYTITKQTTTDKTFSISKSFNITRKLVFSHSGEHQKSHLRNLLSIQNEAISLIAMRSKELWLVQENHATVKLDSSVASCGMKAYSESRIELWNLQILKKKCQKVNSVFVRWWHQSSLVSRKAWMLSWILQELKK